MKKATKIASYILLAILILLSSAYFLLRSPKVQTYLTQSIASYLSKKLKTKITIGGVDVEFIKKIVLEDVYIEDLHQDTLLYISELKGDISSFNRTKQEISVHKIILEQCNFYLSKYESDSVLNIQFIIDALSSQDTTKGKPWSVECSTIELIDSHFSYIDYNELSTDSLNSYANMQFEHISTLITDISIHKDTIKANISSLAFSKGNEFILKKLSTHAEISPIGMMASNLEIQTPFSSIKANASLHYEGYNAFSDFVHAVIIEAQFDSSRIYLADIAAFAPQMKGFNEYASLSGKIKGTVDKLKAKNLSLYYGKHTHLEGNFSMAGLPDIDETFMEFKVKTLTTSAQDLRSIPLYPFSKGEKIQIPENLNQLNIITFEGEFTGFYNDFVAYGNLNTAIGNVHSDISLHRSKNDLIKYNGKIESDAFHLGKLLEADSLLGVISMDANINGRGLSKEDAVIELKGIVNSLEFNHYTYRQIDISGELTQNTFTGAFSLHDPNAIVDFSGSIDFSNSIPEFHFSSKLEKVQLTQLHLMNRDSSSSLSAKLDFNFKGNSIDNLLGSISISSIYYAEQAKRVNIPSLVITSTEANANKKISIRSALLNADLNGKFTFEGMQSTLGYFLTPYLPTIAHSLPSSSKLSNQTFQYKVWFGEQINPMAEIFLPDFVIHPLTQIEGSYASTTRAFTINMNSPLISIYGNELSQLQLWGITLEDSLKLSIQLSRLGFTKEIGIENVQAIMAAQKDIVRYNFAWNNKKDTLYKGDLLGYIQIDSSRIQIMNSPSQIVIADSSWTINNFSTSFDSSRIVMNDFKFYKNDQFLKINGILSKYQDETAVLTVSNFDIQNLNFLLGKSGFKFKGIVNGIASVQSIFGKPDVSSSLVIKDFTIDNDNLGDLQLRSVWDDANKVIKVDADLSRGELKTFAINGNYFISKKENYLDLAISLNKFKLDYLSRFTTDIFSDIKGLASGEFTLKGDFERPLLNGKLQLQKTSFRLDYTNETYTLADDIYITDNIISFDSIPIFDSNGNNAIASGEVSHHFFKDFKMKFHFVLNNFECLNTTYQLNNSFYGTAFLTGLVDINGTPENLVFDIKAKVGEGIKSKEFIELEKNKTEKSTKLSVPIEDKEEVEESDFVTFVSKSVKLKLEEYKVDLSGLQLNFDLEVTPDAEIQIIFDQTSGDIITAKGNGKINMEINTLGNFNMYGDYVIEDGMYQLSMKEIINKNFKIEKGGSIIWNGDPYEAVMDITAIYRTRASLHDLNPIEFELETDKVPVSCNLILQGGLMSPAVKFSIDFPGLEEDLKSRAFTYLSTEQDINKQVSSLLVFGQFAPQSISATYVAGAATTTSSDYISKILSSAASKLIEGLDVKYNIEYGEAELSYTKQIFNDRISIQVEGGNVNTTTATGESTSKIVGDFTGEIKLTKDGRWKGKVYNKSEEQDLLSGSTSYTQGLGLLYRREFDTFSDLFRKSIAKKN